MDLSLHTLQHLQQLSSWKHLLHYGGTVLDKKEREQALYNDLVARHEFYLEHPDYIDYEEDTPDDIYEDLQVDKTDDYMGGYSPIVDFEYRDTPWYHRYDAKRVDEHLNQHLTEFYRVRAYYDDVYVPERTRRLASVSLHALLRFLVRHDFNISLNRETCEAIHAKHRSYQEELYQDHSAAAMVEHDLRSCLRFMRKDGNATVVGRYTGIFAPMLAEDLAKAMLMRSERAAALLMSQHRRLGSDSPLHQLDSNTLETIYQHL